jgi:hypothetical protein
LDAAGNEAENLKAVLTTIYDKVQTNITKRAQGALSALNVNSEDATKLTDAYRKQ